MNILNRYVLTKFLKTFLFVVGVMVLVVVVIDFTEKNHKFIQNKLSTSDILGYYYGFVPYVVSLVTPITAFIATVYVTAQLSQRTELIAILSSGKSFINIIKPFFIGSLLIAIISFLLNGWVIPHLNKERVAFEVMYVKSPYFFSDKNVHFKVDENSYLYLERYDNNMEIGYNITIENFEENKLKSKLFARQIIWKNELEKWRLKTWRKRELLDRGEEIKNGFELDTALLVSPSDFDNNYRLNETFTINELNEYISLQQLRGADDINLYKIEKYMRIAQPFTVILLVILGVVIASRKSRQGKGYLIALGFSFAFAFIISFVMSRAFAENGSLSPLIAIWLPNIIFGIITSYMYKLTPK
ncbi:MAG: LptF/LptG family permease [Flammeovirgaceae bacterium]